MKRVILFIVIVIVFSLATYSQDFKIGIVASGGYTRTSDGRVDPNGDGVFKVLSEDGFNIVRTYEPTTDGHTKQDFKNIIQQVGKHNLKVMLYNEFFFKISDATCTHGLNQYNLYNGDCYVPAFDDAFSEVYRIYPYKNIIWGYDITGESHDPNHPYPMYNMQLPAWKWGEEPYFRKMQIPKLNVDSAFVHFGNLKNTLGISNHKLINCPGPHNHKVVSGDYIDEYLSIPHNGDVCYDAGYFHGSFKHFNDVGGLAQYRDLQLGKYYNLDFYRNIRNYSEIHTELNFADSGSDYSDKLKNNTNQLVNNYNFKWFETYNSIIYGVQGVWFYSLGEAFGNEGLGAVWQGSTFAKQNFPNSYKNYLSNLAREIRFLKEKGFLENSSILTKKDARLSNDMLDACSNYQPSNLNYTNAKDIYDYWIGTTEYHDRFEDKNISYINENRGNEKFGIHYTIRSNGSEIIMILTNPSPIILSGVKIHIDNVSNPILQQSSYVDVLFENKESVFSNSYKTDRNSNTDWINKAVNKKYSIDIDSERKISLDFGPYDTHVLLFSGKSKDTWTPIWHNSNPNDIGGWGMREFDEYLPGDFDGDGDEELFCVQQNTYPNAMQFANICKFNKVSMTWGWYTSNNGNDLIDYWGLNGQNDRFVVGNFDGSNTKDELLIIQKQDNGYAWSCMYSNRNSDHQWEKKWGNAANGKIGGWLTSSSDKYLSGDFDCDGIDELLCIKVSNTLPSVCLLAYNSATSSWYYKKNPTTSIGPLSISTSANYYAGSFSGRYCLLCRDNNNVTIISLVNNNWVQEYSKSDHSLIKSTDIKIGDFDQDGKDEILGNNNNTDGFFSLYNYRDNDFISDWTTRPDACCFGTISFGSYRNNSKFIPIRIDVDNNGIKEATILIIREYSNYSHDADLYRFNSLFLKSANTNLVRLNLIKEVEVYPNPVSNELYIKIQDDSRFKYSLIDLNGNLLIEGTSTSDIATINLTPFSKGTYLVRIETKNNMYIKKIIKI